MSKFKDYFKKFTKPPKNATAAQRLFRKIIGFTVLGLGIVMMIAPGPAIVVIPVGLAILATEYTWARRYLKKFEEGGEKIRLFFRKKEKTET
jgi:tellurite resistance protein TerC